MAIADDLSVTIGGDIRWVGGSATYTVLELHRFLQDLADNAAPATSDDLLDITNSTPSNRQTDNIIELLNGYNIDDTVAQHFYDGSIIQSSGDVIYDGLVVLANAGMYLQIIQNGALISPNFWTTGLNADATNGISHRFMVKVRTGGTDIDGRRILGTTREWGKTYSEFKVNGTSRGNNVLALNYVDDLNNQTLIATIAALIDIANGSEGYTPLDVNADSSNEFYYSEWDRGANTINTFYEYTKWLTRRGTTSTLYGLDGDLFRGITNEIDVDTPSGTFVEPELISWSTGTGQLLAINSPTSPTKMWIQLLTGVAPVDNATLTGGTSAATALVNTTVTTRTVSTPFIGTSTGLAIIGAYGIGLEATDLTASDKVFDLTNTQRTPPNYVTFTVGGLVSGEDRVLVGPETAGGIEFDQLTLNTTLSGGTVTSIVATSPIPSDTPTSGTIRIELDNGTYRRQAYTSYSGSTFSITSTSYSGANQATSGNNIFISYIDKLASSTSEAFTVVYNTDRSLYIRVRDGAASPIKTFETTGTLGSAGGSTTAIRTSDS